MDTYKVIISPYALSQLTAHHDYLLKILKNEQAAASMWADALRTIERLSVLAGSLKYCRAPQLHHLGYHIIHFKSHKYLMLYRIENQTAYIEAIYHELQDYENLFSDKISDQTSE